jgi:AcrR family transcriptional regulator
VLRAAIALADQSGIESISMRKLGQRVGVEAMSLYNHVANKNDILDGMVDLVVGEIAIPRSDAHWSVALRETAGSAREVLLRHTWAPALIQSRVAPSHVRFRYSDALIGSLRRAGFSLDLAYTAQLTINSYIYGFTLHEVSWPFDSEEQLDVAADLGRQVSTETYPHLGEMLGWIMENTRSRESDFYFGLDLILDGIEKLRRD